MKQFQPTLPARGATERRRPRPTPDLISTHAPRTGSDKSEQKDIPCVRRFQPTLPARGATCASARTRYRANYFNPRSPHGERPDWLDDTEWLEDISTHAPRTGSDASGGSRWCRLIGFQPTLPARGATAGFPAPASPSRFQPTLPARGATTDGSPAAAGRAISTHAPRTGSDVRRRPP